jgi:hypothetical protein
MRMTSVPIASIYLTKFVGKNKNIQECSLTNSLVCTLKEEVPDRSNKDSFPTA